MKYVPPLDAAEENAPFIDGNPEHGILGSIWPAKAAEHPQREIVEVILRAGLTPNGEDLSQLWQALEEIIKVKVSLATLENPGLVYPDGSSCTVDNTGKLSMLPGGEWKGAITYTVPCLVLHEGRVYLWKTPSGPGRAGVGAKEPGAAGSGAYWLDYEASVIENMMAYKMGKYDFFEDEEPPLGWEPCLAGEVENFSATYPKAAAYFSTPKGQKRLVTQAQYDALHVATWHTNADGSKVGWKGIGGVNKFVWDKVNDTLRLPDLAGMTPEQIGDGLPGVGGVHGDGSRRVVASADNPGYGTFTAFSGAFFEGAHYLHDFAPGNGAGGGVNFDSARVTPVAAKVQPRAWGSLACVYLGQPAS